jgi:tagatose 6-phosphate kinase
MVFRQLTLDAVNRAATTLDGPAGKSINVAKVLCALGERPLAVGLAGGDRGAILRASLKERGIAHEFIEVPARTRECVTVIDQAAGTHTELVEETAPVPATAGPDLMRIIQNRIRECRAVIMSGTLAPGIPVDFYAQITLLARQAGVLSVVDAQGPALAAALATGPDIVKPNRLELAATVGRELRDDDSLKEAMTELAARGAQRMVITAGGAATLAQTEGRFWRIVPPRLTAVNPIGSGDAFTAGLVMRLLQSGDWSEACRWAAATGAANALTLMAGEVERAEVERLAASVRVEPA